MNTTTDDYNNNQWETLTASSQPIVLGFIIFLFIILPIISRLIWCCCIPLPFCCFFSTRCFDFRAIKRAINLSRVIIILYMFLSLPLLYMAISLGSPMNDGYTHYNNGSSDSFNYGYGRALCGILITGIFGFFAIYHPFFRFITLIEFMLTLVCDYLSSIDLYEYIKCIDESSCPIQTNYNLNILKWYLKRDYLALIIGTLGVLIFLYIILAMGTFTIYFSFRDLMSKEFYLSSELHRQMNLYELVPQYKKRDEPDHYDGSLGKDLNTNQNDRNKNHRNMNKDIV